MEFLNLIRQAIAATKSGDYLAAAKAFSRALCLALDCCDDQPMPMGTVPYSDVETCCAQLEGMLPDNEGYAAIPWATFLPIILDMIRFLLEKRK